MTEIVIRASSLNNYPDCFARAATGIFTEEIEAAGYVLRTLVPHVGGLVGTSIHAGASFSLTARMNGDTVNATTMQQATDLAVATFEEGMDHGVVWDDTTKRRDDAQQQIRRMVREVHRGVLPHIPRPVLVEEEIKAKMPVRPDLAERGIEVTLVGHPDVFEPDAGHDHKTGVVRRANMFQYGLYSRLGKAHGFEISKLFEHYVPRVRLNKDQPAAETYLFDVNEAEKAATAIVNRMVDDLARFQETGDPWSFMRNPQSMLCSDKFCPAHGTKFCTVHKGAKGGGE